MKLLLDENVTPKVRDILTPMGYDVECAQSLNILGASDADVFQEAIIQGRALITHNGRDFIVQIPPRMPDVKHSGLLWAKHQITRGNAQNICNELHTFFCKSHCLNDSIWVLKAVLGNIQFKKIYPPV